jgi:NADH-quinone oxidoreductase subunit H
VWFEILILPGLLFCLGLAFFYEWVLRKTVAKIQTRFGPLYTGPVGILQPIADFIKLFSKEDISHRGTDKILFTVLPIISLIIPLFTILFIPVIYESVLSFEGDLFLVFSLFTIQCLVLGLAGYSSRDRFSIVGGMRTILLLIAFDISLFLVCVGPALQAKTLSINSISKNWFLFSQPLGFGIFILCSLAKLEILPFDIPEAKSEIVAGWLTEFSGKKLAFFRLSHDLEILVMGALGTTLFLGGPGSLGIIGFLIKTTSLVFLFSLLTALFARFRIDQAVKGSWKYLIPLALLQILLVRVFG